MECNLCSRSEVLPMFRLHTSELRRAFSLPNEGEGATSGFPPYIPSPQGRGVASKETPLLQGERVCQVGNSGLAQPCLLYTSDAADE